MTAQTQQEIPSPCIRLCTLDQEDVCLGCHRHINEITAWHSATREQKLMILANAERRKADDPCA